MHPKDLQIEDFNYELPENQIARYPLAQRDHSKLLIFENGHIQLSQYFNLPAYLPSPATLVFNNTKVVAARIHFQTEKGAPIELFCLEPANPSQDMSQAMQAKGSVDWICLIGGAKKWKTQYLNKPIQKGNEWLNLRIQKGEMVKDAYQVNLSWNDAHLSFAELLELAGNIPLPPYLNRAAESIDTERYQTVYAKQEGSVAAPTAGLHFTQALLQSLAEKQMDSLFVTLHVGAGTFKPVKTERMEAHNMHAEFIELSIELIQGLQNSWNKSLIAVGTTSLRTLESIYWLGLKAYYQPNILEKEMTIHQWDPYENPYPPIPPAEALIALKAWMEKNQLKRWVTKTQILIAPGYSFQMIDGLITNFHQPKSTLLLLVAALVGKEWKTIYEYALNQGFRFLSYGDGCLILNRKNKDG